MDLVGEYLSLTEELKEKYGDKSAVLMQCGGFFEVYALRDANTGIISGSNLEDIARILNFVIANKSKEKTTVMAGFPNYNLDRHLPILLSNGYTIAVYIEDKINKTKNQKGEIRVLDKIYSPGTYISSEFDNENTTSNQIMCIWLQTHKLTGKSGKHILVYGASCLNNFTGELYMIEGQKEYKMDITTFDELERFVSTYNPSETIIVYDNEDDKISLNLDKICQFSGIEIDTVHYYNHQEKTVMNCLKQTYMKAIIDNLYNLNLYDSCAEFSTYQVATQSMCFLLNFIREHDSKLAEKIKEPVFFNASDNIILANHTLSQLNIISNGQKNGKTSSVLTFLNSCSTQMGRRLFKYQVTHPTNNEDWLQNEYDNIENLRKIKDFKHEIIRKKLMLVKDLDKMLKLIVLETIIPKDLYSFYDSIRVFNEVTEEIKNKKLFQYLCGENLENSKKKIQEIVVNLLSYLDQQFIIENCYSVTKMYDIDKEIIKKGIDTVLDEVCDKYTDYENELQELISFLNNAVSNECITKYVTDKGAVSIRINNTKVKLLKEQITSLGSYQNIEFVKATNAKSEIRNSNIISLCQNVEKYTSLKKKETERVYREQIVKLKENYYDNIENLSKIIAKFDVILNKMYISVKYKYSKPQIDNNSEASYFDAKGLRHCLIEKIQQDETYVDNDIYLGRGVQKGVLLYGTNSVGKTSLIRSIGIAVIMAQAGMYVPCSSFLYKPYNSIFSRILGNDNLFKGLSTFTVEMSELRTILNMADQNSLILGDELCSGTETESALSIFVSGLMHLRKINCSYIFATHFHEIVNYSEVKEIDTLCLKHLQVLYDKEKDCLVFDRKLKDGSGQRTYGLEVCKSLHMNNEFIDNAFKIRNKHFKMTQGILSNGNSTYNSQKIKGGLCEICNENEATEIHHMLEQKDADENGFVGYIDKDHKANLVSICKTCHDKITYKDKNTKAPKRRVKTTKGMQLM